MKKPNDNSDSPLSGRYMKRRDFLSNAGSLATITFLPSVTFSKNGNNNTLLPDTESEVLENAKEGIEKYRKADLSLGFKNANGEKVRGLKVEIEQLASDFDWGCSNAFTISETMDNAKNQRLSHLFREVYNCTTAKCYWDERWHQPIEHEEGVRITRTFAQEIAWGLANGMRVKGHPLVWTVRKAIPGWMDKYPIQEQMKKLENHVRNLIKVGGPLVTRWDLCNEMLWEPSLRNLPERNWPHLESIPEILTYLEPAVYWAREENPNAIYSLNDYGLVETSKNVIGITSARDQRNRYLALVAEMKNRGCQPDAIGVQAHIGGWYKPSVFRECLDHLSQSGLPVQVTEFWARADKNPSLEGKSKKEIEEARAEYIANIYTIAFGHPAVSHLTYWGNGGIQTSGEETLPHYHRIKDLIKNQWITRVSRTTDQGGAIAERVFTGKYIIRWNDEQGNMQKEFFTVNANTENRVELVM